MSDKYKLIIQAEDGRTMEKLFDSMEELEKFKELAVKASGAVMELTSQFPPSPGIPSVDVYEEKTPQPAPVAADAEEEPYPPGVGDAILTLARAGKIPVDQVRFIWDHAYAAGRASQDARIGELMKENARLREYEFMYKGLEK